MRLTRILVPLGLALLLGACAPVPSLHSLFTDDEVFFDEALLGNWAAFEDGDRDTQVRWSFEKSGENSYALTRADEKNKPTRYKAHLVRLGTLLFFDAEPDPSSEDSCQDYLYLMPTHVFGRIWVEGDIVRLAMLDDERLKKSLDKNKAEIAHDEVEETIVLTAATKDLQNLAPNHAQDEEAFSLKIGLHRQE